MLSSLDEEICKQCSDRTVLGQKTLQSNTNQYKNALLKRRILNIHCVDHCKDSITHQVKNNQPNYVVKIEKQFALYVLTNQPIL